jgi:hypothetical protein
MIFLNAFIAYTIKTIAIRNINDSTFLTFHAFAKQTPIIITTIYNLFQNRNVIR